MAVDTPLISSFLEKWSPDAVFDIQHGIIMACIFVEIYVKNLRISYISDDTAFCIRS